MNTKPNGLHPKFQAVTQPAPRTDTARGNDNSIPYMPAATEKQLAAYRLELELDRHARNRNVRPTPLRVPGGAA